jgi:catalase
VITPEQAVDSINERFGRHPGHRALHAKGTFCKGQFTATPEAAKLTRAAHMQGTPVEATARVSNGAGNPKTPDYAPDVRGLAVSFHLPDGSRTDIVSQTAPRFPVRSPDAFIDLVRSSEIGPAGLWKLPLFLARHPGALPSLRKNLPALRPPASYATRRYYAIHAYKWIAADGSERWVRYTWLPEGAEENLSTRDAKGGGRDYLQEEIAERLGRGPVRFTLQLQVAADGDPADDPMAVWPEDRETVAAGTLELTELAPEAEAGGEIFVFDPVRVSDGIELSDDPILRFRPEAYSISIERRTAG